jgi:hypothetical protein
MEGPNGPAPIAGPFGPVMKAGVVGVFVTGESCNDCHDGGGGE